jgi:hypothetical protein
MEHLRVAVLSRSFREIVNWVDIVVDFLGNGVRRFAAITGAIIFKKQ